MTDGRRVLGQVDLGGESPERSPEQQALAERAIALLREEVERMAAQRADFAVEKEHGAPATERPRLDAMAARLEGASRFALRLGLVSPAEARQVWHEAAQQGLHDRGGDE
jgi:hypothetical protein